MSAGTPGSGALQPHIRYRKDPPIFNATVDTIPLVVSKVVKDICSLPSNSLSVFICRNVVSQLCGIFFERTTGFQPGLISMEINLAAIKFHHDSRTKYEINSKRL